MIISNHPVILVLHGLLAKYAQVVFYHQVPVFPIYLYTKATELPLLVGR